MRRYALRRLFLGLVCLIGVSLIVFIAVRLTGDVTELLLPEDATKEDSARLRAELGLDKSIPVQYVIFVKEGLQGNFGRSTRWTRPAMELVLTRLPATVELGSLAFAFAVVAGLLIGVVSATRQGSVLDVIGRGLALLGQSMPSFWIGIMLILFFAVQLRLLPTSGRGTFAHLVLPALALSLYPIAAIARLTRSALLGVLGSDYIKMARLKGNREGVVIWKHALKNAAIPVVTLAGLQLGNVMGHAVIIETVFAWPGLGKLIIDAVYARDYSVVQAGVCLLSAFYIFLNTAVDLAYGFLDPRIRYE